MNPDVYIVMDGEAIARDPDSKEIIATEIAPDGTINWDDGAIADARGAGGAVGFAALDQALWSAEANHLMVHGVTPDDTEARTVTVALTVDEARELGSTYIGERVNNTRLSAKEKLQAALEEEA